MCIPCANQNFEKLFNFGLCSSYISALIYIHDEFRVAEYSKGQKVLENALAEICVQLVEDNVIKLDIENKQKMANFFRSYIHLPKEERKKIINQLSDQ